MHATHIVLGCKLEPIFWNQFQVPRNGWRTCGGLIGQALALDARNPSAFLLGRQRDALGSDVSAQKGGSFDVDALAGQIPRQAQEAVGTFA